MRAVCASEPRAPRRVVVGKGCLQTPTAQTLQFYALTFFPGSSSNPNLAGLRIDRWNTDQSVTNLTSIAVFSIADLTHTDRMRFTLEGTPLSGEIFNLALDPSVAVQSVSTFDSGAGAVSGIGVPGIMTYPNPADINAPTFGTADVTCDSSRVVPTPGALGVLVMAGVLAGRRRG